jgi:outer membrane lipoprotein LolB
LRVYILACVVFLAGCASTVKQNDSQPLQASKADERHVERVQGLLKWHAKGRLAVKKGDKGGNASFVWQQIADRYQVQMHGPFGSGAVVITGGPNHVTAKESNGKKHSASTPEVLMQQLAGWQVPLAGLQYWIRGVPIPGVKVSLQRLNAQGLLENLVQDGWNIHISEYTQDKMPLPKKMQLQNGNLKIKLIVTTWSE